MEKTEQRKEKSKKTRRKIFWAILAVILIALAIALPLIYSKYYTTPRDGKPDRKSEGIVPTEEDVKNAVVYDHVVIFGVDGAGGYFSECDTPNFDRIFSEGNVNYNGLAQYPTISAENWGSMILGVTSQTHGINNNGATTIPHLGIKYPSFFKTYSKTHKKATYFSAVDWPSINIGIIEDGIPGMRKRFGRSAAHSKDPYVVGRKIAELVAERTKKYSDTITFMQFDAVDHAGHAHGSGSPEYIEAIQEIDKDMGIVYDAYKEKGWLENTLFICVTDHGHVKTGGHGGEDPLEKQTTLAVAGGKGNIVKGTCGKYVTHDLAPIVLYALGVQQPSHYEGGVPKNLFTTLEKYN